MAEIMSNAAKSAILYEFKPQPTCNMCGSAKSKVLGLRLDKRQGFRPRSISGVSVSVKKCTSCDLVYADPLPIPARVESHYDMDPAVYFDDELEHVDLTADRTVLSLTKFQPGMKALDIGAGLGRTMKQLSTSGWDVWGIEPSASFRNAAVRRSGIAADRIIHTTIEDAEFAPGMFDFINFGAVLEHLYSPSDALARAVGWLRPGGVIYVEVPSSRYLVTAMLKAYYRLIGVNYVTNLSPLHPPFHLYEFSHRTFEINGKRVGYRLASHKYEAGQNPLIPRKIDPLLRWGMNRFRSGMQLKVYLRPSEPAPIGTRSSRSV
jgi:SAM-dependent methyltransferase